MRIPDYPSNREADDGAMTTALGREGAPEDDAKSGDLFADGCPWDGAELYDDLIAALPLFLGRAVFLFV